MTEHFWPISESLYCDVTRARAKLEQECSPLFTPWASGLIELNRCFRSYFPVMNNVEPYMFEPVYLSEAGLSNAEVPDGSDDDETGVSDAKPAIAGESRLTVLRVRQM